MERARSRMTIFVLFVALASPVLAAPGPAPAAPTATDDTNLQEVAPRHTDPLLPLMRAHLAPQTWRDLAHPSRLDLDEEQSPGLAILAKRFNPAMVFPTRDIWPVDVRYAWHDGSDLRARTMSNDGRVMRDLVALSHQQLAASQWGDLPQRDDDGHRVEYYVDAPGDDRVHEGLSGWRRRWRAIMEGNPATHEPPHAQDYPPTQYAHAFWLNRQKGLLAIQYWFYYPYNEWINHHEGDWEHVNVILRGPTHVHGDSSFRPVGYQFFFHTWTYEPHQVVRIRGADPREDHVVVYAGGSSRFFLWSGQTSGGSYPLPAVFPAAGGGVGRLRPADDTSKPARFLRAEDINVTMLPEPDRVNTQTNPELAWLRLPFFAGQARVFANPFSLNGASFGKTPQQPCRQTSWDGKDNPPYWNYTPQFKPNSIQLPRDWRALVEVTPRASEVSAMGRRLATASTQQH